MANRAIELLKETFTNLGPRLMTIQSAIHEDFISNCMSRLKVREARVVCSGGGGVLWPCNSEVGLRGFSDELFIARRGIVVSTLYL